MDLTSGQEWEKNNKSIRLYEHYHVLGNVRIVDGRGSQPPHSLSGGLLQAFVIKLQKLR
jgi:hypothetical protein